MLKKKWFFPAVYLVVASLLIGGVLWYQNSLNQIPEATEDMQNQLDDLTGAGDRQQDSEEEDATAVMQQQESLSMPVADELQVEVVTKFYDYNADAEEQEKGLILHQNTFYQSDGIAISTPENESFDVTAALSGTVAEVKEDPLLGNVVKIEHEYDVSTYYASLGEVLVEEEDEISQGESIGSAGENAMGKDNGIHVHFEVRKEGTPVNPEEFINQPISKIVAPDLSEEESTETDNVEEEQQETEEAEEQVTDEADDAEEQMTEETDDAEEQENTME